jgi:hypothetical protein
MIVVCPMAAQAVEMPEPCKRSTIPMKAQQPIEDLGGKLPVPDYLDGVLSCSGIRPADAPQPVVNFGPSPSVPLPGSAWLDGNAKLYSDVLAKAKYRWLVLPAQTQYMGFDLSERLLISQEITAAFADQGNLPDALLVSRALGEPKRRYSHVSVERLTARLGAQRRVSTYVGHDGARKLTLTVQLQDCDANGRCKVTRQRDWRGLAFTDEQPPFRVIAGLRTEIRRDLLGKGPLPATLLPAGTANLREVTPAKLFAGPAGATAISLLASLAPDADETTRDRLQVMALRGWVDAPASADGRFFAAYAALRLQRRPYALELIRQQRGAGVDVLREVLNGNLTEANLGLPQVKNPLQRLMLGFAVQDLAMAYGQEAKLEPALPALVFGAAESEWIGLISRRLVDANPWRPGDPRAIKLLLDAAAPIKGMALQEFQVGSVVAGRRESLDLVNFRHLRQATERAPANSLHWQALWLAEGLAQSDVFTGLMRAVEIQAAPESGLQAVQEFEGVLEGHPAFEMRRALVSAALGMKARNEDARRFNEAFEKSEWSAAYWSQGQNYPSRRSLFRGMHTLAFIDAYSRDFPPKSWWSLQIPFGDATEGPCVALRYSLNSAEPVSTCLAKLPAPEADKLREELRNRFHGNRMAVHLAAPVVKHPAPGQEDDTEVHIARMRAGIQADPGDWLNYAGVGGLLLQRQGKFAEAQKVYLSYPAFKSRRSNNRVELGNNAYDAASELYWRGQPDLAQPLYAITAGIETGSAAFLNASARVAQLAGDYETAASFCLERATRYESSFGYRDYLSLLYAMGFAKEADAAFLQVKDSFSGPQVWQAALVGQRMAGTSFDKMQAWVTTPEIMNSRNRGTRFAGYYALLWSTLDRKPGPATVKLMERVESGSTRRVDGQGLLKPHAHSEEGLEIVKPSALRAGKTKRPADGTPVTPEYVLLARALSALHAGQYQAAVEHFTSLADNYPIEDGETKLAMPYFALAAAKTGDKIGLETFIEGLRHWNQDYYVWVSRAFFAAVRKQPDKAEHALKRALYVRLYTDDRPVMNEYQWAEACEIIGRETGDPRFIRMMLEWARQYQRVQPTHAWPYSIEAQYSKNPADAKRALAFALHLDPQSPRLAGIGEQRRAEARAWFKDNNPFRVTPSPASKPVT